MKIDNRFAEIYSMVRRYDDLERDDIAYLLENIVRPELSRIVYSDPKAMALVQETELRRILDIFENVLDSYGIDKNRIPFSEYAKVLYNNYIKSNFDLDIEEYKQVYLLFDVQVMGTHTYTEDCDVFLAIDAVREEMFNTLREMNNGTTGVPYAQGVDFVGQQSQLVNKISNDYEGQSGIGMVGFNGISGTYFNREGDF